MDGKRAEYGNKKEELEVEGKVCFQWLLSCRQRFYEDGLMSEQNHNACVSGWTENPRSMTNMPATHTFLSIGKS